MEAIYIPSLLKSPNQTEDLILEDFIDGLETLTPVRGQMSISHRGTYLEIRVDLETIMTLTCDRCLQQYNHRLSLQTNELIWLDKTATLPDFYVAESEIMTEDLAETLPPNGYFDPEGWLYEQLSLAMPLRQLCGKDCQPPANPLSSSESVIDSRWASLATLKNQLSQSLEK